jgi:hypothetical protein
MWMTMNDFTNLVFLLEHIPNKTLHAGRLKSITKYTKPPKAKHIKALQTLSFKINPKRTTFLKAKLIMMPHRSSIKNDNFFMWTVHKFQTPPVPSVDLHNKMVDVISHMTMMVTVQFSMIKRDADNMTTLAAMSFTFHMIAKGR